MAKRAAKKTPRKPPTRNKRKAKARPAARAALLEQLRKCGEPHAAAAIRAALLTTQDATDNAA